MIIKNKGMFLETVLNTNIEDYEKEGLLIRKMPVNSSIIEVNKNIITSKAKKNDLCDYIGLYKGIYIEFEAKETELDYFNLNNLKENQRSKLNTIFQLGGASFLIVYFHKENSFFGLPIQMLTKNLKKKIPYQWFIENGYLLEFDNLKLNIITFINHLIS
ncbi:recombination protein U [Spiroplasma chinense]|uniref:Holliday junction resolvase RecU n=1 Tax=Spiroplasma chinense TaxID=216932 RepID=A0A5B9Y3U4_9MOLU|nr:Holliday junction resolvase RecU [Spiroplasma chinense]QEH61620.1 recombination protein U [Spiroplasma chinense]